MNNSPIGIFDSGVGGLSVRAEIACVLPRESLIYFGDGTNVPYGPRPHEDIIALTDSAVGRLVDLGVKMVVVACNTATGAAIDHLRAKYDIPIIGMEPAVKPAALSTVTGTIGVLATVAAFRGELYKATSARFRDKVRIVETVGEGFVEIVESDREDTPEALDTVRRVVWPMLEAGADRIVLGCTHYPYLAEQIRRVIKEWSGSVKAPDSSYAQAPVGCSDIRIIDSAPAIARRVEQLLSKHNLHADVGHTPQYEFLTAADDVYLRHLIRKSEK